MTALQVDMSKKPDDINVKWDTLLGICGSEELLDAIIEVFLEEGKYTLGMIENAIKDESIADIKLYCHRMKGTARYLGDEDFVEVCLAAELAATDGELERAKELAKKIAPPTQKYLDFFSRADWKELLKK